MVPGLDVFFEGLTVDAPVMAAIESVNSYPNPFNPQTELHVTLNQGVFQAGQMVSIRIYNVRGALVRELYANRPAGTDIRVRWDGRDNAGRRVASSTYFGVVEAGGSVVTQKLSMIK
jgi:flagellar hook assembly protein FlgD